VKEYGGMGSGREGSTRILFQGPQVSSYATVGYNLKVADRGSTGLGEV